MGWGQVWCDNCGKEVSETDYIRSNGGVILKYDGCTKCGKAFGKVKRFLPGDYEVKPKKKGVSK